MNLGFQKTMAVGPRGGKGDPGAPGRDGTGAGTVTSVNGIEPDDTGDVTLPVPPEPDLSGLATEDELWDHTDNADIHVTQAKKAKWDDAMNATTFGSNSQDPNDTVDSLILTKHANTPFSVYDFTYIHTLFYLTRNSNRTQIAMSYLGAPRMAIRNNYLGVWTPWEELVTSKLPARTNATLTAGWTNSGGTYQPLSFYKDQFGVVHLQGMVNKGSTAGHQVTTLPVGIRPQKTIIFYGNYNNSALVEIIIEPSGAVMITGGTNTISVNASFRTD